MSATDDGRSGWRWETLLRVTEERDAARTELAALRARIEALCDAAYIGDGRADVPISDVLAALNQPSEATS